MTTPDPEDTLLRQLPAYDVKPARREQIRRRAHAILNERRTSRPLALRLSCVYHRFVEPAVLVTLGFVYLAWTVQETLAIFQ